MDRRSDLRAAVHDRISAGTSRKVWTPADFLDLGGRDAIDKTLQRLVAAGGLRRIDRGLYDQPTFNALTQQPSPPDPRNVIDAVARRDQIRVLVDGMTAANDLGLTNAVPARIQVHADARLRPIRLGGLEITFRPTAASKLFWAGRPAMRLVQALHWLRDTMENSEENEFLRRRVTRLLNDKKEGGGLRADLRDGLSALPAWMQVWLKPMLPDEAGAGEDPEPPTTPVP